MVEMRRGTRPELPRLTELLRLVQGRQAPWSSDQIVGIGASNSAPPGQTAFAPHAHEENGLIIRTSQKPAQIGNGLIVPPS
jgi:hypothetical protein